MGEFIGGPVLLTLALPMPSVKAGPGSLPFWFSGPWSLVPYSLGPLQCTGPPILTFFIPTLPKRALTTSVCILPCKSATMHMATFPLTSKNSLCTLSPEMCASWTFWTTGAVPQASLGFAVCWHGSSCQGLALNDMEEAAQSFITVHATAQQGSAQIMPTRALHFKSKRAAQCCRSARDAATHYASLFYQQEINAAASGFAHSRPAPYNLPHATCQSTLAASALWSYRRGKELVRLSARSQELQWSHAIVADAGSGS